MREREREREVGGAPCHPPTQLAVPTARCLFTLWIKPKTNKPIWLCTLRAHVHSTMLRSSAKGSIPRRSVISHSHPAFLHQPPIGSHRAKRVIQTSSKSNLNLDPTGLVVLPVFAGSSVLLPTYRGVLRAYEPRYIQMFTTLASQSPHPNGRGAKFLHILGPNAAPPAMLTDAPPSLQGLPSVGCCAVVESIRYYNNTTTGSTEKEEEEYLVVEYAGHRRVILRSVVDAHSVDPPLPSMHTPEEEHNIQKQKQQPQQQQQPQLYLTAAGEWYDDDEDGNNLTRGLERDVSGVVKEIARLSRIVDPEKSALPEAIARYAPPRPGTLYAPTSYDALKAAGHRAATAIDMWRAHGSVYSTQRSSRNAHADPYTQMAEELGRERRQEMFSYAVSQLLQMGTPEAAALLLSRDTAGRLEFVMQACRPFLQELGAAAALKNALK